MIRIMAIGLALAGMSAVRFTATARAEDGPLKVVVHINFSETGTQGAGLRSVANILKDDPQAKVEVVCHAAGIGLVEKARTEHAEAIQALIKQGATVVACENTMRQKSIRKEDLLPGVGTVPSGAVEVVRKQHKDGYAYFKP
ncbi:hypothetical protein SAMN05444166_4948 [Singulisphaera sp. GP187]|uniref:DsrE family protein n=1 Tax=Singulisphaera sp. GP187 TaxID=1882752 RepID=UPI000927E242|nr:DsrE family protein [Singulisphaera sp. GP187]SIO46328.1 hypothetical protein SAMN05444166_4948 [Singulisphaera sp. GP187]